MLIIPKGQEGEIEDLFDSETLATKINGKSFDRTKKIDTDKMYGKFRFAEKIIMAKQKNIDFSKFKEVFDGVRLIIEDYQQKHND